MSKRLQGVGEAASIRQNKWPFLFQQGLRQFELEA